MQKFKIELKNYLHETLKQTRLSARQKGQNGKAEKVTQETMAAALHITPRAYGELERGRSTFSATTLLIFLTKLPDEQILNIIHTIADMLAKYEKAQ